MRQSGQLPRIMKSRSLTFATHMLFRLSGSELFDTFKNIILLRIYPIQNIYSWIMLRKQKWQIPGETLAARYNWCQGPVPGHGPAVEKHCSTVLPSTLLSFNIPTKASLSVPYTHKLDPDHEYTYFVLTPCAPADVKLNISLCKLQRRMEEWKYTSTYS